MSTLYIDRKGIQLKLDAGGAIAFYENNQRQGTIPLAPLERIIMRGDVQLPANLMGELGERGIGVLILSGRKSTPTMMMAKPHNDAARRIAQYRLSTDEIFCQLFAQCIVRLKLQAQYQHLSELRSTHHASRYPLKLAMDGIHTCIDKLDDTQAIASLRGLEGAAAASYFGGIADCMAEKLQFTGRNRRPPKDPLNVILSLGYTLLHAEAVIAIYSAGLDPYIGFYHGLDFGRESLACDLIEPLRPHYDQIAIQWFKQGILRVEHFSHTKDQGCLIGKAGRTEFYKQYESVAEHYRKQLNHDVRDLIETLKKHGLDEATQKKSQAERRTLHNPEDF